MKKSFLLFTVPAACLVLSLAFGDSALLAQEADTNAPPSTLPEMPTMPAMPENPQAHVFNGAPFFYQSGMRFNDFYERGQPRPVIFSDLVMNKGETNFGDAVVVRGNTTINGVLEGHSITVLGDATINGTVTRDVQVVMGSLKLGPKAEVGGNIVVVGGSLERAPGSRVRDGAVNVVFGNNPVFKGIIDWLREGFLLGRPFPPSLEWVWIIAGLCLLVNLLLMLIFPRPIQACVATIESKAVTSFFVGLLAKLLAGLFMVLLTFSVVGIIIVPFLAAAYFVATLFGKITAYRYVGQQLGRLTGLQFLQSPAVALILGTAVFYLLYMVPYLGFVAWEFSGFFGFGAVVLATFQQFRAERSAAPAAPIYLGSAPPLATGSPAASFAENPPVVPAAPTAAFASEPIRPPAESFEPQASFPMDETAALPRGGFWIRLFAAALDAALFMIIFVFLNPRNMDRDVVGRVDWWDVALFIWFLYHVFLWKWRGTTVGGIIVGIKVVRLDGGALDFPVAVIRALASVLSFFVLGLGFFWAGFSSDKQSWHDKIAGTVIVKVPRAMSLV